MRARRIVLALVSVLFAAGVGLAFARSTELRAGWLARKLETGDADARKLAAEKLAALGPVGIARLEQIAFARDEVAKPADELEAVRQAAIDALWGSEPRPISQPRLARFLVEARGLRRSGAEEAWLGLVVNGEAGPELEQAALVLAPNEPDDKLGDTAIEHLLRMRTRGRSKEVARALAETLLASPSVAVRRKAAVFAAMYPAEERRAVEHALDDPDEDVRVEAAINLAFHSSKFDAATTTTPILAATLRASFVPASRTVISSVVDSFLRTRERRVIAPLLRVYEAALDKPSSDPKQPWASAGIALMGLTGHTPATGEKWSVWWNEHARDFPEQIDPEKIRVGPLHASGAR